MRYVCLQLEGFYETCAEALFPLSTTDVKSTLFAIFELHDCDMLETRDVAKFVTQKLADIPDCTKFWLTCHHSRTLGAEIAETLGLSYYPEDSIRDNVVATILEVFYKRWETLDIVSMMKEVERTVNKTKVYSLRRRSEVRITNSLSKLPRFQKTDDVP